MKLRVSRPRRLANFRKSRRSKVLLGAIIVVMLGLYWMIHMFNSPAYGSISQTPNPKAKITDSSTYSTLSTPIFSILYPSQYNPQIAKAQDASQLEYHSFATADQGKSQATLTVYAVKTPDGGIVLTKEYQTYKNQPQNFQLSTKNFKAEPVILATQTKGGHLRVALWEHGKYTLVVMLNSPDKKQNVDIQMQTMLGSVQW